MPKLKENTNNKNTIVIAAVIVAVVLAGVGYFAWQKSIDKAARQTAQSERQASEVKRPDTSPQMPTAPSATMPELLAPTPTPWPVPVATPVPALTTIDPCQEATEKLQAFFNYLDQQEYVADYTLKEKSTEHFALIAKKLFANPPVVNRETDDLFTILTNSAHFYRILGKKNLLLIKDILNHEADNLETIMADFYNWSTTEPDCDNQSFALHLPLNSLYEYAGFFLNTLGGQSYLFRRESKTRMLVKYYAVLVIDQANEKGLNRHGIDIRTPLRSTIGEMEVSQNLAQREAYLEKLLIMQAKYQEKYGNK